MKNLGIKNIIMGIFVIAAVVAFMVFSGVIKIGSDTQQARGTVVVWGTIPYQTMQPYIDRIKGQNLEIIYSYKDSINYENELVNAFASGTGPDAFIMSHEGILRHRDKIFEIPYASIPRTSYETTYIDEARLFLSDTGVTAFPLTVNPLVMYYNRPLITSAFILDIPEYWEDFIPFSQGISDYSGTGEILTSAVALGTYNNIEHAKGIISSLIMQNGNALIGTDSTTGKKISVLALDEGLGQVEQALSFYTSFAQSGTNTYSWNEALPNAQSMFISGDLAIYFGSVSEATDIRRRNPNLDFGVALFPQIRGSRERITYGAMTGVAVSKHSRNPNAAVVVASRLTGRDIAGELADALRVAPTRIDLLRETPSDTLKTLAYRSAMISRGWLDADLANTNFIFETLVRNINSRALSLQDAIMRANADINTMLNRTINLTIPDRF